MDGKNPLGTTGPNELFLLLVLVFDHSNREGTNTPWDDGTSAPQIPKKTQSEGGRFRVDEDSKGRCSLEGLRNASG